MLPIPDSLFPADPLAALPKGQQLIHLPHAPDLLDLLHRHLLLVQRKDLFTGHSPDQILYNAYHYLRRFLVAYEKAHGYDAGLRQQELEFLESLESVDGLDWEVIEKIHQQTA